MFLAISPVLVAAIGHDEEFIKAGWLLLFCTWPAAIPGCCVAALLAVIACGLAIARGAKRTGILGIIALLSPPFITIGADLLPSDLRRRLSGRPIPQPIRSVQRGLDRFGEGNNFGIFVVGEDDDRDAAG